MLFKIVVVLVAVISVVHGQCSPPTGSDGTRDGSFRYSWQNLNNGNVQFNVTVVTAANTWGAIGFSLDRLMPNTDVVIAGDDGSGNNSFVEDRWNPINGPRSSGPTYDTEQNIFNTSVMRNGDTLYFSFTRPIVSPDNAMDIDLDQCVYVLWALGGTVGNFTSPASLGGHSSRGVILHRKLCIGASILQPAAGDVVSSGTVNCTVACEPYFRDTTTGFTIGLRRVASYSFFVVSFSVNTAEDTWAAVGFNFNENSPFMPYSDVVVGGFNASNDSFVEDRWNGEGRMGLLQDTTQDITEACAARIDETLIVTFVKPIGSSSTPQDLNLTMDNPTFRMIWAFGGSVDSFSNPGMLGGHDPNSRGPVMASITAIEVDEVTPSPLIPTPTPTPPIVIPPINIMQTSDGLYSFRWLVGEDRISFAITVTTPANTWAAIGFSNDQLMPMSDVVIAGNDGTNSFVEDRWITNGRMPSNIVYDTSQDISDTFTSRNGDVLTIIFSRRLNTSDPMDLPIGRQANNECVWVLWAYGGMVNFTTTPVSDLTGHTANGVFPIQLCGCTSIMVSLGVLLLGALIATFATY